MFLRLQHCFSISLLGPWFQKSSLSLKLVYMVWSPPPYLLQTPVTKIQWSVNASKHNYMTSAWTSDAVTLDALLYRHSTLEREFWDFCSFSQNRISPLLLFRLSKRSSKHGKRTLFHVRHVFRDLQTHQTNSRCTNTHSCRWGLSRVNKGEDGWWLFVCRATINAVDSH